MLKVGVAEPSTLQRLSSASRLYDPAFGQLSGSHISSINVDLNSCASETIESNPQIRSSDFQPQVSHEPGCGAGKHHLGTTADIFETKKNVLPLYPPIDLSFEQLSIFQFFDQLSMSTPEGKAVGWLYFLPQLYQDASAESCLIWTIKAAAYFLFENHFHTSQLLIKARECYGMALRSTNAAIQDPVEKLKDETLCTILLLNILDVREVSYGIL